MYSLSTVLSLASILIAGYVLLQIAYNRLFSPLRNIPGPFLASITGYWLVFVDLAGFRTTVIHKLHLRYGPTVRIGPQEVSFASAEAINTIYGQQTVFMKAPIYESMSLQPLGIFSIRDKEAHSQRRSLLSHAFSSSNLQNTEPVIRERVDYLMQVLRQSKGSSVDALERFRAFSLDVVGQLFLGASFGALEAKQPPQFLHDMDKVFLISGMQWTFPWMFAVMSKLPVPALQDFLASKQRVTDYGKHAYEDYLRINKSAPNRKDLLSKILFNSSGEAPLTDRETYTEVGNLVFAGTDTTSTTLTYLCWELTRNPELQTRLRQDLQECQERSSPQGKVSREVLDSPLLEAVINESLRLHPAAPASLQRITPPTGATVSGVRLPASTIVSMQCYTTNRDAAAFPDPDTFSPDRWLKSGGGTAAMKELFMPFSKGTRACLGKNLAFMELKLVVASLFLQFGLKAPPQTTDDSMAMRDHFLVLPKGGKCDLLFESLNGSVDRGHANAELL
ncbi:hypothetical protein B0A48_09847 [Cryoendolithus antarcticus]|uniref:Cytochrome P450 n=1 Tax=Cryoendolithus antarcticus TaxID=1507870 RepID=A0A1V8T2W2_9PEZI|nr:hypothetical protein B0A48_09847 [Cryoendolithus antarcticus]